MKNNIPIFFTFDNNYVIPAAVAFDSLLKRAKSGIFYKMYVLHSDISEDNQALLQNIITKNGNGVLEFISTKGFLENEWKSGNFDGHNKKNKKQFTSDAIIRCFAAKFFPQYQKIIYSDVDVVFMDDVSELINVNLENKYIAAVKNAFIKYSPNELSHLSRENYEKFKDTYFAGGIWVLNLDKIRKDKLEQKMIEIINNDEIIKRWNDQDIMNLACDNKVEYLSLRYISYPYMPDFLAKNDFVSHFSREELEESYKNPKILHFAFEKPWNSNPKLSNVWWEIFNQLNLSKTSIFEPVNLTLINKAYYSLWKFLDTTLRIKGIVR